jgi:ubiquinone/menaquinone biosynthesis C-methylase UbiE
MVEALKSLDFQGGGLDILDVCCGPATWLCETSLEYPNCHFSGVDMCSLWPQVIRPVNLDFTEANILQGIPYPDKSFGKHIYSNLRVTLKVNVSIFCRFCANEV